MPLFLIIGGLLLAVAILIREKQMAKERRALLRAVDSLRVSVEHQGRRLRRAREDIFLLRVVLQRRDLLNEKEFDRIRLELLGQSAGERQPSTPDKEQLLADGGDKLH